MSFSGKYVGWVGGGWVLGGGCWAVRIPAASEYGGWVGDAESFCSDRAGCPMSIMDFYIVRDKVTATIPICL